MHGFELVGASVPGRDHTISVKNSQDGMHLVDNDDFIVAVVTDGCGSSAHSEVGAKLGARWLAEELAVIRYLPIASDAFHITVNDWNLIRCAVLDRIRVNALAMGGSFSQTIEDYFLFTAVVALITPLHATFAAIGDGEVFVNGERLALGPFPGNAPPYLAYGLVKTDHLTQDSPNPFAFKILATMPTTELQSFLIGTDGVAYLAEAENKTFPGTDKVIGPLSNLWTEDRFFKNSDMVRRHLALANRTEMRVDWQQRKMVPIKGHLKDDTTLVVGRIKAVAP